MQSKFEFIVHICGTDFVGRGETKEEAIVNLEKLYMKVLNDFINRNGIELEEKKIQFRNCLITNKDKLKT